MICHTFCYHQDLLTNVDSVIYADIDMLFLAPVEELWSFFTKFNSTQIVAAVPVYDLPIPIVGPKGMSNKRTLYLS